MVELESRIERKLSTHDQTIAGILDAIRQLMMPPEPPKRRPIGFVTLEEKGTLIITRDEANGSIDSAKITKLIADVFD